MYTIIASVLIFACFNFQCTVDKLFEISRKKYVHKLIEIMFSYKKPEHTIDFRVYNKVFFNNIPNQ